MEDLLSLPRYSRFWTSFLLAVIGLAVLTVPFSAHAEPKYDPNDLSQLVGLVMPSSPNAKVFGGQASFVKQCSNKTIYAILGPPRGGAYIWTPTTRTYKFGKPAKAGQWLLGLKSIPFLCLYSSSPIITLPGIGILMLGTSQPPSSGPKLPGIGSAGSAIGTASKLLGF